MQNFAISFDHDNMYVVIAIVGFGLVVRGLVVVGVYFFQRLLRKWKEHRRKSNSKLFARSHSIENCPPGKFEYFVNDGFIDDERRYNVKRKKFVELEAIHMSKTNSIYCLENFEEGNLGNINPELSLDEQADLLPYDKKYEFSRERLQLGKRLGSGAFGVVIEGMARGILPHESETKVAVKMVKKMANSEVGNKFPTEKCQIMSV